MCECWIVKFTARCLLWCGTQEALELVHLQPATGDKCLSFQKVYHRAINNNQQEWKNPWLARARSSTLCAPDAGALRPIDKAAFTLIHGDNPVITHFFSDTVSKRISIDLKHMIHREFLSQLVALYCYADEMHLGMFISLSRLSTVLTRCDQSTLRTVFCSAPFICIPTSNTAPLTACDSLICFISMWKQAHWMFSTETVSKKLT